jgi:hypothetical protein
MKLKEAKFETYRPEKDEFKMAKPKALIPHKPYVPKPHPQAQRLLEAIKK